jgi:hypothetical protein
VVFFDDRPLLAISVILNWRSGGVIVVFDRPPLVLDQSGDEVTGGVERLGVLLGQSVVR